MGISDTNSLVRIVRLSFKEEHLDDFLQFYSRVQSQIAAFEGCLEVQAFRDNEQPNVIYTISRWADAACLENYRQSDLFRDIWARVSPWFDEKPQAFSLIPLRELARPA